MKKNLGIIDQVIRFLIAFVTVVLYLSDTINGRLALILFIALATTALLKFCPVYSLLRFNTLKKGSYGKR